MYAKEASLTAIELFDGPNGAAYVQVTDFLINGKAEVRGCGSAQTIDKSSYGKFPKIQLSTAASLERNAQGVMMLTVDSVAQCVVPSNLKLEKESVTPAELADRAVLQGKVLSSSSSGIDTPPPLKPGVKIVFVAAADTEGAEYLRAERAHSIAGWQDYLGRYPKAAHTDSAKQALAALLVKEGENGLATYRTSSSSTSPSYADLKIARARADQALEITPSDAAATKLRDGVRVELETLTEKSRTEFQAYKQALSGHTAGYAHLGNAQRLIDQILDIDPRLEKAKSLQASISTARQSVDSSLMSAESLAKTQRFDEALSALGDYRIFADEEPRVAAVVNAAYKYHLERGKTFESQQKWQESVQEYQRACEINKTEESSASLKKAEAQLKTIRVRAAADAALAQSADYEQQKQFIEAYEVLANLPDASRALVSDRMQTLAPDYVKNAADAARKLQEAHTPIRGLADEVGALRAYEYLQRISELQPDDHNVKLRQDLLSETISDYYVQQAKRYLDKPLGSGVGLAWLYLDEAQQFKPNRDDVRDERTKSSSVHYLRSKLSIRVVFRDQTSRRDSAGFADQLSDAIATGLETSGLPVKVIRANDPTTVEPNFQLVGDVVQHRPILNTSVEPMESKYRVGEREVPNDDWNRANRDYETATLNLQNAQKVLEGAQAHGKKKEISEANNAVAAAQQNVEIAHQKLDAIPKTLPNDVIKPYTYTKKTVDLTAVVELAFRVVDAGGNTIETITPITRSAHKTVVMLENVKPEDTEGVKQQGAPPDEIQFLTDVEIEARDALIKEAKEKVDGLPGKILQQARRRVSDGDLDGAAEAYILYLNSTPDVQTSERGEAKKFLHSQFNIARVSSSS